MEHRARERVKEQSHVEITIKTEVEETVPSQAIPAYVDTKIDVNHLKLEPGLVHFVKIEPVMLVKIENLKGSNQDKQQGVPVTSARAIMGRTSVAAELHSVELGQLLHVKEELEDTNLNIGPTVLQHMDSRYRTTQLDLNDTKQENTILNVDTDKVLSRIKDDQVVHSRVSDETIEGSRKDSSSKQEHGSEERKHQCYRCDKCQKVFNSKYNRNRHNKFVHGTESHKCSLCKKEFKCKEYLLRHIRDTHKEKQYNCDFCNEKFKLKTELQNHVSIFHRDRFADPENGNYRCDKCMKVFRCKKVFKRHCEDKHGTERPKCTECNKEYKCMRYLQFHIKNVHSKQQFECDICKNIFRSKRTTRSHILRVHGRKLPDSYSCDYCQKTFHRKQRLIVHIESIHGEYIYKCSECSNNFRAERHVVLHMKKEHPEISGSKDNQISNVRRVHREEFAASSPAYICDYCGKVYYPRSSLVNHIKEIHARVSHRCAECKLNFVNKHYFENHVNKVHRKLHACEFCKRVFGNEKGLNRHVDRTHRKKSTASDNQQPNQATSTPTIGGGVDQNASRADHADGLANKQESRDADLNIEPTVLQHMDSRYTLNQVKVEHVKMESSPLTDDQTVKNDPDLSMKEDIADV